MSQTKASLKYNTVARLHNKAKELGFAVVWNDHEWMLIPADKMPDDDTDVINRLDIAFEGETLEELDFLFLGIDYGRREA